MGSGYTVEAASVDVFTKQNIHDSLPNPNEKLITLHNETILADDTAHKIDLPDKRYLQGVLIKTSQNGVAANGILTDLSVQLTDKISRSNKITAEALQAHVKKSLALAVHPVGYYLINFTDFSGLIAKLQDCWAWPNMYIKCGVLAGKEGDVNTLQMMTFGPKNLPQIS